MLYTKIKELGRGGFGLVSEVRNEKQESFAMKEFRPNAELQAVIAKGIVTLAELKKRFFKEVKYQSKIKSRNIVQIIDSDLKGVVPWYVMELAVGTLQDDLAQDRTLGKNLQTAHLIFLLDLKQFMNLALLIAILNL